jgi:uncharacterized Zn finger protein
MRAGREGEPTAAIEYSELICPLCEDSVHDLLPVPRGKGVTVTDIAQVKAGWLAQGEIQPMMCRACGHLYTELVHLIPIECAAFPCPSCGPGSKLTTEILSITRPDTGYSFVVLLKCDDCSKQHRLSKLLGGLSKITKIKVGPTGVEVEVKT